MTDTLAISFDDVAAAHQRLAGIAHRTPVLRSRTADARSGGQLFFKAENLQHTGAFKIRGAYNAIAQFTPAQAKAGVVTFSSGNHAQAIARAAALRGVPALVLMPEDAPAAKREATCGYGAEVIGFDRYREDGDTLARRLAEERGLTLVPPFDHPHVIAGEGTAAKEFLEEVPDLDYLFVCVGGGGLLAGSLLAAEALAPQCRVVGVEPAAGNDGQQSFKAGHVVQIPTPHTIADGAQTQALGQLTFPVIQRLADDMVTATDEQLVESLRFFAERMKIVVEPTGALAFAGAQHGKVDIHGARVGVLISGGNVDLPRLARFLAD